MRNFGTQQKDETKKTSQTQLNSEEHGNLPQHPMETDS